MEEKKKIEIVSGDGSNLNISPAYDNLDSETPDSNKKPKHIIIPQVVDKKSKDDKENKK